MQPKSQILKSASLGTIVFSLIFGSVIYVGASGFVTSNFVTSSFFNKQPTMNKLIGLNLPDANIHVHTFNTQFSDSVPAAISKPSYPKPSIKLLVFKIHLDKQLHKTPSNITLA